MKQLHMFASLNTGIKIPVNLALVSAALPVNSAKEADGTIIFTQNGPQQGIFVRESLPVVGETLQGYYTNQKGGVA